MKNKLYNWTKDKGINPFDYGLEYPKYTVPTFSLTYLDEANYKSFCDNLSEACIHVCVQQEIGDLIFVQSPQASNLVKPLSLITAEKEGLQDYIDIEEVVEDLFETDENVQVLIDYPLDKPILLTIPPLHVQYRTLEEAIFPLGYICWQIALAYGHVFKHEFKKAGVWGHGLADLQLSDLLVYGGNKIVLEISS